jgi:hypothetical protein
VLAPCAALAWHFGPGVRLRRRDRAAERVRAARRLAAGEEWAEAAGALAEARSALGDGESFRRRSLLLAEATARTRAGELVEARGQLEDLLAELDGGEAREAELLRRARSELAANAYYTSWLMRLEGADPREWKAEAEKARQHFRLLAEREERDEQAGAFAFRKNLESTIRLQLMDRSELQGLPLPRNCRNCGNTSRRRRRQRLSRRRRSRSGDEKKPGDVRKQLKQERGTGAGLYVREEGTGS